MKKISILLLFALLACLFISAQQGVAINTDGSSPHASAMLEIKSTNKGLLIPRMTSSERGAIVSPALGLLVYETTSNSIWAFNGIAWVQLGGSLQWTTNGTNIYNSNSGNVGVGTSTPASKFHLMGNMLMGNSNPVIQFQQAGTDMGFIQFSQFTLGILHFIRLRNAAAKDQLRGHRMVHPRGSSGATFPATPEPLPN
jgi:hypothetical protein